MTSLWERLDSTKELGKVAVNPVVALLFFIHGWQHQDLRGRAQRKGLPPVARDDITTPARAACVYVVNQHWLLCRPIH